MLLNLGLLSLALLAVASPSTRHSPHPRSSSKGLAKVVTSCAKPNHAALTFDDGPHIYLKDICDELVAHNAKGTFFFNGNNYACIYDDKSMKDVKYAYDQGHQIGSHTWAHKDLTTLSYDEIDDEMARLEQALQRIIGVTPAFMRPPYGSYNEDVQRAAFARGQTVVIWDLDSGDSVGVKPEQSKKRYQETIGKHPDSIMALNHETYQDTAKQVVPFAIKALQEAGYILVTLAECLGEDPYQSVGKAGKPDKSWVC